MKVRFDSRMTLSKIISRLKKEFFNTQFLRFLLVGGTATCTNFFSRFLFRLFAPYEISLLCAYTVGAITSFFLNKYFTFRSHDENAVFQAFKFTIISVIYVFLGTAVAYVYFVILSATTIPVRICESLAHLLSIATCVIYSYFATKYFAFRKIEFKKDERSENN